MDVREPAEPAEPPGGRPGRRRSRAGWFDRLPLPAAARRALRFVVVVVVAIAVALFMRAYVVEPFYVPSQSMEPTLHGCPGCDNDHVLAEKVTYHFHPVRPGDIVVFHRPSTWPVADPVLVKRVIGVGGDVLELSGGRVYRNHQLLREPYVNRQCRDGTTDRTGSLSPATFRVPAGELFVMGDNRCDSEDSRYFGPVPAAAVIGRVVLIVWPLKRFGSP